MAPPAPDPRASPRAVARAGVGDDDATATFSGRDVANAPPGALAQTSMRRRLGIPVAYSSRKARRDMFAPSLVVPGGDPRDAAIHDDEDPPPGEDYHHDAEEDDRLERYSDISSVSGYSDRLSTASGYTGLSGISGMYYPPSAAGHAPHDHFHVPGPRNPRESRESNPAVAIAADDPDDVDAPRATPSERADAIAKRTGVLLRDAGGSKQKNPDENTAVRRSSSRRDAAARRRPPPDENDLIEAAAFGPRLRSARGGSSRDFLQLGGGFGFRRVGSSSSFASFASSKSRGSDASSEASRRDPEALYGHLETLAEAARAAPDAVEAVRFFLARRAREEGVVVFAGGGEEGDEGVGDDAAEESSASKSGDASSSSSVAMRRSYAAFANELDQGRAALHVAAERDDSRLAIALIDSFGADPSIAGALGLTPAHVAAYCGATSTLESILDRGGDVNAADEDGSTPLHWAASAGRADAVRALLGRDDVDAFSKNARGQTAEALGLVSNAKTASAFRDLERAMAPHALARAGKLPILRRMLEREGLEPNVADARGETLAHHAARGGAWRVVEALVAEYGAKPDARCARRGATPVHVAAERGHVAVLDVYHRLAGWERILQTRANAKTLENTTTPEDEGTERGPGAGGSRSKSSRSNKSRSNKARSNKSRSNTSRSEKSRSRRRDQDRLERDPAGLALDAGRASGGRMSRSNSYSTLSRSASFRKLERVRSERSLASLLGRFEEDDDGSFSSNADDSPPGLRTAYSSRGKKTDFRVAGGSTPAHLAAIAGEAAAIAFLVDKMFAAVDARDADGQTPLHVASARGHVDVVEALLSRGARPDAKDRHGCTPLHVAAEQNREAAARRLLRRERDPMDPGGDDEKRRGKNLLVAASIDARDSRGNAAAHLAAAMGHASMVLGLLPESTSASRAADAKAAAALAKLRGPRRPGEALEGRGVDATGQCGWTCLHFAAHGGYADLVEALVRDGADVERRDVTGATPTHLACEGGDAGCVEMLLAAARKRDRSSRGDEVGREAGREVGRDEEVGAVIEEDLRSHVGLSTDSAVRCMLTAETDAGFSPAHVAALAGHAEVLALLFREAEAEAARVGASPSSIVDVNATTRVGGYAPLHLAAMRKHDAVARLLLRRGARVASTAGDGRAALHFAAASGSLETARLLLDATAKVAASVVNARSLRGETPASLAFGNDHLPTALFLLERGADPFVPDEDGNTCLHACALAGNRDGFLEILRFAYTMGLSMRILRVPNAAGMRPIHLAAQGGSVRMTRCLVDRGADVGAGDLYGRNALMVACESGNLRVAVVLVAHARENGAEPFDADDVTPARLRWMSLRRSLPDIVAAAKSGRVDPAAPNGVAEQALVGFALRRLGLRDDATGGNEKTFTREAVASGYDSERSDRSDGSSSSRGESSDVDAVEDGPSAAGARKVSLLEVLDKAREQFKRRQRDRYVNALSPVTGYGALHVAAERGDVAACRFLLDHGAEIDRRDANRGDAPLHVAAREGRAACVAFLCRRGAKQRAKNETWYTPLHVAAKNGDLATLDALLDALRRNDRNHSSSAETTSEVIDRARRSGTTPLHTAVERRHGGVAARLLASGADWNARTIRNESVIHFAAKAGDADVLAMLLEKRREAIDAAEEREDEEEDSEDSAGAEEGDAFDDPLTLRDHTESFPLHWAAECGHARCVELLLDANSTPLNIGGMWRGSTAAHLAARQGRLETLELLYERGADVNAQDAWNYATPLIVAAEGGHASTVAFLLAKRVRAEARDKFGTDAAQCAGTAETKMLIRRHTTLRRVRLLLRGADASDCFLGWRDARLDAKATRQRESKGTWQMVFALFGESALARYYWLWRQWHSGNARARRAVGGETAARLVDALEKNPGFAGLARARVVALAEKALRGEDLGEEGGGGGGEGGESGTQARRRSDSDLPRASDRLRSSEYAHHPGVRVLSRGEALWTEGSPNDGRCYAFLSGRADVFMTHETAGGAAEEARVARLRPGSTIGELALRFASAPRTATVRARSETCAVACVHRDAFAAIVAEEHDAIEAEAYARDLEREKRRRLARRRRRGRKRASPTEGAALERSTVDPDELARFFASYFSRNDDDTRRKGASRSSAPRRALSAWEAELLRATLTVATFEPGDACPVAEPAERAPTRGAADASRTSSNEPEHLRTNDGLDRRRVYDVEDGFVGLVLSGEVVTVDAADAREVVRAGEAYVSIASRATRRSRVELRGCCTCYVAADARSPARVAVLQGLDLKDLPETFRATFLGDQFAVPKFWDPPPRDMPRSTADYAEGEDEGNESWDSEDSEEEEEEDEASDVRRRGATRSDDGSNPDGSRDVSSDSDSESDASDALDARGLRPEFVTQLVEAFRFVDTDNGGDIDENELKFAARALGFEPDPRELKAMLAAMDEDGGGTVDLGEFVGTVTKRVREVTSEAALDDGFDAFDADRKGFIVLEDVANAAKRLGDNVTSEELDALMDLGAADLNDDGEIDRDEFAQIMDFRAVGPGRRRAAIREEIKRQARAASEAEVVAEMLGEYGRRRNGGARTGEPSDADAEPSPLRASLVAVFASILGPGRDPSSGAEIDVRDLIDALRRDGDGDGSLAKMLHLPSRIRADDGSAAAFEKIFREIDADGSGAIDVEEFVEYFRNLKKEKATEIVARAISRFEEVDEDEDEEGEEGEGARE